MTFPTSTYSADQAAFAALYSNAAALDLSLNNLSAVGALSSAVANLLGSQPSSLTDNTFYGFRSGRLNVTGVGNTGFGYESLTANNGTPTAGSYNSAFGYYALQANTSGQENSAFGEYSMAANTTGVKNVAMGAALRFNLTGGENAALGHGSLYRMTTATRNVGVGAWAGYGGEVAGGTTTGSTFLGAYSGYSIQASTNNTFAGYNSGLLVTTGSSNLLLGYQAGAAAGGSATSLTTGSSNIIIGMSIDLPGGAAVSNKLNIANLIYSDNIDGSGQTNSTGHVLIGNSVTTGLTGQRGLRVEGLIYANTGLTSPTTIACTGGNGFDMTVTSSSIALLRLSCSVSGGGAGLIRFYDGATAKWRIGHNVAGADFGIYDDNATAGLALSFTASSKNALFGGNIAWKGTSASIAAGSVSIGGVVRTTIGANGGATALTALPLGYIDAYVGSTPVQIPYYNRGA